MTIYKGRLQREILVYNYKVIEYLKCTGLKTYDGYAVKVNKDCTCH